MRGSSDRVKQNAKPKRAPEPRRSLCIRRAARLNYEPAVWAENLSRHERSCIGSKKKEHFCHLFSRTQAAERRFFRKLCTRLMVERRIHVRIDHPWGDAVDANARRPDFLGKRFCESDQSGFGC